LKILITGVAGFIGFHLAKRLLDDGHEVVGLDNINDYYDVNLKYGRLKQLGIERETISKSFVNSTIYDRCKFIRLDVSDRESIERLFADEQFGAVAHLAAQAGVRYSLENPHTYIESNIVGFINILEGCRKSGIKNLSFASSSSVYGLNRSQPFKTTDHTDHPVSLYAATKKSTEMMAHSYAHLYGIEITGLRPGEKLKEELFYEFELPERGKLVSIVIYSPGELKLLKRFLQELEQELKDLTYENSAAKMSYIRDRLMELHSLLKEGKNYGKA